MPECVLRFTGRKSEFRKTGRRLVPFADELHDDCLPGVCDGAGDRHAPRVEQFKLVIFVLDPEGQSRGQAGLGSLCYRPFHARVSNESSGAVEPVTTEGSGFDIVIEFYRHAPTIAVADVNGRLLPALELSQDRPEYATIVQLLKTGVGEFRRHLSGSGFVSLLCLFRGDKIGQCRDGAPTGSSTSYPFELIVRVVPSGHGTQI